MKKTRLLTGILILLNYYLIIKSPLPANLEIVNSRYLFHSSVISIRLFSFTAFISLSMLISKKIKYFTLALLSLPWSLHIYNFEMAQILVLCFVLVAFYFVCSNKKYAKQAVIISTIVYIGYFYNLAQNPNYYLFIAKLKPDNLALEINEQQKTEFLATNKQYILPSIVRKISHNKPLYAFNYIIDHLVGYFDIEQWSLSNNAYDQLKLSGVAPKPYFILVQALMLPLVIISIFLKSKLNRIILFGISVSVFSYFLFEKQYLYKTAFIALPFLALGLANAIKTFKYWVFIVFALGFVSTINYYRQAQNRYTTDIYYYNKIAAQIKQNGNSKYVVTNSFGPTDLYLKYYLKNIDNVRFENFSLDKEEVESNTIYIGFPAEFTGLHKEDINSLPANSELLGEIEGEDQIVSNFGNKLWIVKVN